MKKNTNLMCDLTGCCRVTPYLGLSMKHAGARYAGIFARIPKLGQHAVTSFVAYATSKSGDIPELHPLDIIVNRTAVSHVGMKHSIFHPTDPSYALNATNWKNLKALELAFARDMKTQLFHVQTMPPAATSQWRLKTKKAT